MSLVEKALQKMKLAEREAAGAAAPQARAATPPATAPVVPPPAASPRVEPPRVEQAATPAPDRAEAVAPIARREAPAAEAVVPRARPEHKALQIDPATLRERGYLPPAPQERELTEQYRHIKRPLVARAFGRAGIAPVRRGAVVMVTSALPREGKTFTAINLTRSIALEKDASVLLIDCDVANPQCTRAMGADGMAGLMDALGDPHMDVESLVLNTSVDKLEFLPIGRGTDMGAELMSSQRMEQCLDRLLDAVRNRIILLDSAPLLITNEGKTLIPLAGQVVLVVHADSTPQHAVLEAADLFDGSQFVGVVLNQCAEAVGLGYGYYGGTYGYGDAGSRSTPTGTAE